MAAHRTEHMCKTSHEVERKGQCGAKAGDKIKFSAYLREKKNKCIQSGSLTVSDSFSFSFFIFILFHFIVSTVAQKLKQPASSPYTWTGHRRIMSGTNELSVTHPEVSAAIN